MSKKYIVLGSVIIIGLLLWAWPTYQSKESIIDQANKEMSLQDFSIRLRDENTALRQQVRVLQGQIEKMSQQTDDARRVADERQKSIDQLSTQLSSLQKVPTEHLSPYDRISSRDIVVFSDRVVIYVTDPLLSTVIDSNSQDPLFDIEANMIQIVPTSAQDIHIGDIVTYDSTLGGQIIHRVVSVGRDDQGWYAVLQGDNNPSPDPGKVRFSQIRRVLIGIVY